MSVQKLVHSDHLFAEHLTESILANFDPLLVPAIVGSKSDPIRSALNLTDGVQL